jgi:hypothetical protein
MKPFDFRVFNVDFVLLLSELSFNNMLRSGFGTVNIEGSTITIKLPTDNVDATYFHFGQTYVMGLSEKGARKIVDSLSHCVNPVLCNLCADISKGLALAAEWARQREAWDEYEDDDDLPHKVDWDEKDKPPQYGRKPRL